MSTPVNSSILAIETSGATCGVCLLRGGEFWGEYSVFAAHNHDRLLAELTQRLLKDAGIQASELSAVAVSAGPGSFTGLRIGAAFAKSLCFNENLPGQSAPKLIAVPTLDAYACAAEETATATGAEEIIALIPSHANLVYIRRYASSIASMPPTPASEIQLVTIEALSAIAADNIVICGAGAHYAPRGIRLSGLNRPTPRFIGRLGARLFTQGLSTAYDEFTPLYSQDFIPKTAANNRTIAP